MTRLLLNRTTSYLQVWHRISCRAWSRSQLLQVPDRDVAGKLGGGWTKSVLKQGRWREAAYGINLEEDQAGDWGQNAVFQQRSHQMSTGRRRHQLLWGQTVYFLSASVITIPVDPQDKYECLIWIYSHYAVPLIYSIYDCRLWCIWSILAFILGSHKWPISVDQKICFNVNRRQIMQYNNIINNKIRSAKIK